MAQYFVFRKYILKGKKKSKYTLDIFKRSFVNDYRDSKGGSYTGEMLKGKYNGFGIYRFFAGQEYPQYRGLFRNSQPRGEGYLLLSPDIKIVANIFRSKKHRTLKLITGDIYVNRNGEVCTRVRKLIQQDY